MLKKILILAPLFITHFTEAQITVSKPSTAQQVPIGKAKAGFDTVAELYYIVNGNDSTCVLLFLNEKLKKTAIDYQSIRFRNQDGTLETLYELFKSVFAEENKGNKAYRVNFTLGNQNSSIGVSRGKFVRMAEFRTEKGYFSLTENQTEKLFGRKD
jgi:hypothetical protein